MYQTELITPTIHYPFKITGFDSMLWTLPKKKKNYGRDTKHINKILKKMGRK